MHQVWVLVDLLSWCRVTPVWVKELVEEAAGPIGIPLSEDWCGGSLEWFLSGVREKPGVMPLPIEDGDPIPEPPAIVSQAARFGQVLAAYCSEEDPRVCAILLMRDVLASFTDPQDFFRCASVAGRILTQSFHPPGEPPGVIYSDEWYDYADLIAILGKEATDQMLREIGYDPTESPNVSGKELNDLVMRTSRVHPHEESEDDSDDES